MSGGVATGSRRAGPQLALEMASAFGDSRRGPAENAAHRPAVAVARGRDHRLRERARVRECAYVDAWCVVVCVRVRACVCACVRACARAWCLCLCVRAQARAGLRAAA